MISPLNFDFFAIRVYYEKLVHILKPLVPKFRHDLYTRFKDIIEKQVPREAETDISSKESTFTGHFWLGQH